MGFTVVEIKWLFVMAFFGNANRLTLKTHFLVVFISFSYGIICPHFVMLPSLKQVLTLQFLSLSLSLIIYFFGKDPWLIQKSLDCDFLENTPNAYNFRTPKLAN